MSDEHDVGDYHTGGAWGWYPPDPQKVADFREAFVEAREKAMSDGFGTILESGARFVTRAALDEWRKAHPDRDPVAPVRDHWMRKERLHRSSVVSRRKERK